MGDRDEATDTNSQVPKPAAVVTSCRRRRGPRSADGSNVGSPTRAACGHDLRSGRAGPLTPSAGRPRTFHQGHGSQGPRPRARVATRNRAPVASDAGRPPARWTADRLAGGEHRGLVLDEQTERRWGDRVAVAFRDHERRAPQRVDRHGRRAARRIEVERGHDRIESRRARARKPGGMERQPIARRRSARRRLRLF